MNLVQILSHIFLTSPWELKSQRFSAEIFLPKTTLNQFEDVFSIEVVTLLR